MKKLIYILFLSPFLANAQIVSRVKSFGHIGTTGVYQYSGTTAQRPTGDLRWFRWNTDSNRLEVKIGPSTWRGLGFNGEGGSGTATLTSAHLFVGNGSNIATDVAASGDLTLSNTGAFTLNSVVSGTTCTNCNLTINNKGLVTSIASGSSGGTDANAWHKTADAFGANSQLGTSDNFSFDIYSNNSIRGTVYNTGKFGWKDTLQLGATSFPGRIRMLRSSDGALAHQLFVSTNDFISNNISGATHLQQNGNTKVLINSAGNVVINGLASSGYDLFVNGLMNVTDNFLVLGQTFQWVGNPLTIRHIASARRVDLSINSTGIFAWAPVTSNDVNYQFRDSTQASGIIMDISCRNKNIKLNFLPQATTNYAIVTHALGDSVTGQKDISTLGADMNILSGNYTATLTNSTNVSSSTFINAHYYRIGSHVQVDMWINITPTATGVVGLGISFPVASNITSVGDAMGLGNSQDIAAENGIVQGDFTNDRATLTFTATSTSATNYYIHFSYEIK